MRSEDESHNIDQDIDRLIEAYKNSSDPEVQRKVRNLRKLKEKIGVFGRLGKRAFWIWVADRLRDIFEDNDDLWPPW